MTYEFVAEHNDFSHWDSKTSLILTKVDKNGTHHYTDTLCPKCGGTGHIDYFYHVDGGKCFLCGGSGDAGSRNPRYKVYTEEYYKVLKDRRLSREKEKALLKNQKLLEKEGFTPDGRTYVVLGKTWEIKDKIKAAGGFYNDKIGWHFNYKPEEFQVKELSISESIGYDESGDPVSLFWENYCGKLIWTDMYIVKKYIKKINDEYLGSIAPKTEWFGEVGNKITVDSCSFRFVTSWETDYGVTKLYEFTSPAGYVFTWRTGTELEIENGEQVTISGKIKALTEFRGIKQTELTRCKVTH